MKTYKVEITTTESICNIRTEFWINLQEQYDEELEKKK